MLNYSKQMSGETINEDTSVFDDYNKTVNFLANPLVNEILMAFPFLRKVPGSYQNGYQAVLNAREKLVTKYFHKIKVCTLLFYIYALIPIHRYVHQLKTHNCILVLGGFIMAIWLSQMMSFHV